MTDPVDEDMLDIDADGFLERVAGHGTFVTGVVRKHAPDADIEVEGVLTSFGDGDDWQLSQRVVELLERAEPDVVNMSFGCYTEDGEPPLAMSEAVRLLQEKGAVVVASAGNDATCRRSWPAALPGVIAVGALDCSHPAWFSNHGPWVDASAPGVGVISTFVFHDGPATEMGGFDPDRFEGWAMWSGTSFAAPKVAAAIAVEMNRSGVDAATAAHAVVYAPGLYRIPDYGVVVNLV